MSGSGEVPFSRKSRSVGLDELRDKLAELVQLAAMGETVKVTERDHVIAELVAPQAARSPFLADPVLAEAVRKGWITPAIGGSRIPLRAPIGSLSEILAELDRTREER